MIQLLEARDAVAIYADAAKGGREHAERATLLNGVKPALQTTPEDLAIAALLETIDSYEQVSGLFQQAFDGINWALKRRGGRAQPEAISGDPRLARHLERTAVGLRRAVPRLDAIGRLLTTIPALCSSDLLVPLQTIRDEACQAVQSRAHLLDVLLARHERVQGEKRKSPWIDRDGQWTLMPGFGFDGEDLPLYSAVYLHPFRVRNMYSFLADLGRVRMEVDDGETE